MSTQNIFAMTDTWNAGATTFTAIGMNVTDTASAAGSLLLNLQVGGVSQFSVGKNGTATASGFTASAIIRNTTGMYCDNESIRTSQTGFFGFASSGLTGGEPDVRLFRDAADTLALRRTTNAQTFRIYETFTDASNFSRLNIDYSGGQWRIIPSGAGTGDANRGLLLGPNGQGTVVFQTNNTSRWTIGATTGHLIASADNTYDIGANGANRPRDIWVARNIVSAGFVWPSYLRLDDGTGSNGVRLYRAGNGILTLYNTPENDFNRLQFGGTTSSFPALKRNSTALETRLADDSAYAPHAAQYFEVTDGITAPGSAAGRARIYVDTADGDLKVVFADGTVKTIVTDT